MNDNDNKITISFGFTDEYKNHYEATSSCEVFSDFGETTIDTIGRQMIAFLRQMTYPMHNDYLLMEDLTEEEYWYLKDALFDYRNKDTEENKEEEE